MHFYLLLQGTVEDEDEHALEGIEDGEEVSHDYGVLIDKQKAESPGQPQQKQQGDGPKRPGSVEAKENN